jgi:hypothetical protein
MPLKKLLFLIPALIFLSPYPVIGSDYLQVAGLIDLRTTYSDGKLDLESLVKLAKTRGFSVLFINDHDRLAMEYGLSPFRNILRKRVELNSINKGGAEEYLNGIRDVQGRHPDMIIIPGSEAAPFYYWTGSYFDKNLTAHNHERRILTVGLQQPEDYRDLPILHNGSSTDYLRVSLPAILLFVVAFILGFVLLTMRGIFRILGIVISGLSVLLIIDSNPFRSSPFDQYHGDQGIAPHQLLIDYVDSRGGLTFWNYPETSSGTRKMGPIFVDTPPYPEVLQQSKNYTGFSALYGNRITATEPGNIWDRVLLEYCKKERDRPVWGISTADFHKDGGAGEKLGNFPTVFLVPKRTKENILTAMREGRMYACRGKYPQRMILVDFSICSSRRETKGTSGNEIVLEENPKIHLSLSLRKPTYNQVVVRLIRSGKLIKTFPRSLPTEIDYEDNYFKPGQKIYYRIDVRGCGTLVSNPIFVSFG